MTDVSIQMIPRVSIGLSAATLAYFLWNILTDTPSINYGWLPRFEDIPYLLVVLLYWPFAICAWLLFIYGTWKVFKKNCKLGATILVLVSPMVTFSLHHPQFAFNKGYEHVNSTQYGWFRASQDLNTVFMRFYLENPDKMPWTGEDDQVDASAFIKFLDESGYFDSNSGYGLKLKDNEVITSWGAPLVFGIERTGDGYIDLKGRRGTLNGYADPWQYEGWNYNVGVGTTPQEIPDYLDKAWNYVVSLSDTEYYRRQGIDINANKPVQPTAQTLRVSP